MVSIYDSGKQTLWLVLLVGVVYPFAMRIAGKYVPPGSICVKVDISQSYVTKAGEESGNKAT